jgi:hypothetical protein
MHRRWPMSADFSTLLELQLQLRRAVLGSEPTELVPNIREDGLPPAARLAIYRNHAVSTLGAVLRGAFPVVCRLVDGRFFAYATHEYLREHPPHSRCLVDYGADFADFLAGFEPCKHLPYLADVARFEWALNVAATIQEASPLSIAALAAVRPEEAARLVLCLQPSVSYFASRWPIDAIWQANQQNEVPTVDLASDGACIEIRRAGDTVAWRQLEPGLFAFRAALADGLALGSAVVAATMKDPAFDLATALERIFAEGLIVGFAA